MLNFDLLSNSPIPFTDTIQVIKPKLSDIDKMGYERFSRITNLITIDSFDIKDFYSFEGIEIDINDEICNPYTYIITQCENKLFFLELRFAFFTYIQRDIKIISNNIVILDQNGNSGTEGSLILNEKTFEGLQSIVSKINFKSNYEDEYPPIISDNVEMVKKFEAKRKLLIETKRKEAKKKASKGEGIEFSDMISSLCAYGIGYTMLNIWNLTIYQFYDQFYRCQMKENYESNVSALMAGAKIKQIDLVYWIKKIQKNN